MNILTEIISMETIWGPLAVLMIFLDASALMIWRLDRMSNRGVEGTVLGTLVMPYCSGMGNLVFACLLASQGGPGREVVINSLVNNVTNLTLLLGLPACIWGLQVTHRTGKKRERQRAEIHRLSLLLTIFAGLFFTGALWALARDGSLSTGDGMVLIGLFLFWQGFSIFDVLKNNVRQNQKFDFVILIDMGLLLLGGYGLFCSIEWLVLYIEQLDSGFLSVGNLGWLSGILMVLPNAGMAFYYAWRRQPDIVASSQLGDGHICIPLCIGVFAVFHPSSLPDIFNTGILVITVSLVIHGLSLLLFGGLPRFLGGLLVVAYGVFLYFGLV